MDDSSDKSILLTLFNLIIRIYYAAHRNFKLTHQLERAVECARLWVILKYTQKYFTITSEPLETRLLNDDTVFNCGPITVIIMEDNIVAHWNTGSETKLLFDFNKVSQLLDDIYGDQLILLNSDD